MTKKYPIFLTETELSYLGKVLSDQPYKEVSVLISNINHQLVEFQKQEAQTEDTGQNGKDSS